MIFLNKPAKQCYYQYIQDMRKARQIKPGAYYHVTARVNNKEFLLQKDTAKALFERVLVRAKYKFAFESDTFVIMGNHFHLLIKPHHSEKLSKIMQWIMSVYAMAYNRLTGRTGHFWGSRFFSRIITTFDEYSHIFQYIELNPVKEGLVESPWQWRYGGAFYRLSGHYGSFIDTPPFLAFLIPVAQQLLIC